MIATVTGLTPAGLRFGVEFRLGLYVGRGRQAAFWGSGRPALAVWCVFASALEQYSPSEKDLVRRA